MRFTGNSYCSFFEFIRLYFGIVAVIHMKKWININKDIIKLKCKIDFLKNCLYHDIIPAHVIFRYRLCLRNFRYKHRLEKGIHKFQRNILRLELMDSYKSLSILDRKLKMISVNVMRHIPGNILQRFFIKQSRTLSYTFELEHSRIHKKFKWLYKKNVTRQLNSIKNIQYLRINSQPCKNLNINHVSTNLYKKTAQVKDLPLTLENIVGSVHPINIKPSDYNETEEYSPLKINNKWFINLSNTQIPTIVQGLLQLGPDFSILTNNFKDVLLKFIKQIEYNLKNLNIIQRHPIRKRCIDILKNLSANRRNSKTDSQIMSALSLTRTFIKNNDNLTFTRADKGNITVAMNKDSYIEKMEHNLNDKDTYILLTHDPIKKLTNELHRLLTKWKNKNFITTMEYKFMNVTDGVIPRAYGLPKIHKEGYPLRIVISTINSPLYRLAEFLHNLIYKTIPKAESYIKNSQDLYIKLSGTHIEQDMELISLDVVSLFTNVPLDLAVESIKNRWKYISNSTKLPMSEFVTAIRLVLNSTFFKFNNKIYQQTYGTPMGSPLSPIIADIVMQDLENKALSMLPTKLSLYYRYVDDIILSIPDKYIDQLLDIFNSMSPRLKFTIEKSTNNTINFLELKIIRNNNIIEIDWYHKPSFSERFLNFYSQHHIGQKKGIICCLFDKAINLSHPRYHQNNINKIIRMLMANGYPVKFIFETINNRIKKLINNQQTHSNPYNEEPDQNNKFFTIPYLRGISEKMGLIIKNNDLRVSFIPINKLEHIIKPQKDALPMSCQSGVVYEIDCLDCDATYTGQTKRQLQTRIKEHKTAINRNIEPSVVTQHRLNGHEFDWENVQIKDKERFLYKRLISEMVFIKSQKNGLNCREDTNALNEEYSNLIESLLRK